MRLLKEILERDTISKWRVPSKSEPKKFHYVKLLIDGSFLCDCVFYQMKKKDCRHIRVAKKILIKNGKRNYKKIK